MKLTRSKIILGLLYTCLLWFITVFLIVPNLNAALSVFWQNGSFTMRAIDRVFNSERAVNSLRNSFLLAPILSITVGFVGVSLVFITEYFRIRGSKILRHGYMTTLIYGGIILVSGYRFLYGHGGFFTNTLAAIFANFNTGWFEGFWAVLFVMTFATTGNHMIFLRSAMRAVDFQTIEAAKNLGANQLTILRRVVLPVLTPSLLAVTTFTFLTGLGATSAPLLVGGRNFQTISPMIISFSRMQGSRDLAVFMAMILGLASLALIGILAQLEKRGYYLSVSKVKTNIIKQKINNPVLNILIHIYAYGLFLIYVAPVIAVIIFSFTDAPTIATGQLRLSSFTLENYINVFTNMRSLRPVLVSLMFSFSAALGAAILVVTVCRIITKFKNKVSTFIEYTLMIPWLLPNMLIALGLITTYNMPRWFMLNRVLTGSIFIMILGYLIIRIPFTLRITRAAFFAIDDALEDAAKNLGAKTLYTFFRVILPIILPTMLAVFALNFNGLLTEFDMSVLLYHPLQLPLGVQIQNLTIADTATADNTAITFVYAVMMMVISGLVLYVVYGRGTKLAHEDT
ncbi:MAG: iron ABC transporter permease [Treponema sp.]|nr:iron ABC transporter permease [Treponema sp.]